MADPRILLVTTIKNEGPNILEWVAHHLSIGFTDIQIFQNDSTDGTEKHLRTLHKMGVVEYFRNDARNRDWQNQAYRRASRTETYKAAEWCMALDGDEFLHISAGNGQVTDLISACGDAAEILVNWRFFGSGGFTEFDDALISQKFTACEVSDAVRSEPRGHKCLFRTAIFKRPGIHRAKVPVGSDAPIYSGSGRQIGLQEIKAWRSIDPDCRRVAQVNHYAVRDAASFLLKSERGSASHPDRSLALRYWRMKNINDAEDRALADLSERTRAKMRELDDLSRGRLMILREASRALWQQRLGELLQQPRYAEFYRQLLDAG